MEAAREDTARTGERLAWGGLLLAVVVAAVGAAVANAIVYFIASALGFVPQDVAVSPDGAPLGVVAVVVASVVGAVGAGIVLAALNLFLRRPVPVFYVISAIVLVLSFITPTNISGAPLAMILTLEVMHVVAAVVTVGVLVTLPRRR